MDLENHWLSTIGLLTSSLIAITANFLLLLVFCRRRGLRTISNRFVINLLVINLLSSLLLVPFLVADKEASSDPSSNALKNFNISSEQIVQKFTGNDQPAQKEVIIEKHTSQISNGTLFERNQLVIEDKTGDKDAVEIIETNFSLNLAESPSNHRVFCQVSQFSLCFVCTASILSILLIGIDQYLAVLHPLRCHSYMSKGKSVVLILVSWLFSVVFAAITASTNTNGNFFKNFCPATQRSNANLAYSIVYFIVIILLPFLAICMIYVFIYNAAHKNSARIRKRNNNVDKKKVFNDDLDLHESAMLNKPEELGSTSSLPKVHSAPNFVNLSKSNELQEFLPVQSRGASIKRTASERLSKNLISSLRTKISNASVFRYREETRTAKISILVIVMVLICYVPYGILFILNTQQIINDYNYISLILLINSNLLSPFLFAYRNRRVQRELKKFLMLPFSKEPQERIRPKIVINHIETDLNKSTEGLEAATEPFLVPEGLDDCKLELEKKSILKRVCSKNWSNYKKCSFINVPDSCLDARGSFSSASTQISTED